MSFRLSDQTRAEMFDLIRLAVPISLGRIGIVLMTTVDFIMVGHFSSAQLAYQSIGVAPVMPLIVIGLGLLVGTAVIVANARGAGSHKECGLAWRRSVPYALGIGLAGMMICTFGEEALLAFGQTPDLARHGGEVMRITGLGLPAFMLFLTTAFFLEGIGRAAPWMVVIFAGNVVNALLNGVLIEGGFGIPAMGAEGAAWATTISRWLVTAVLIAYVWGFEDGERYATRGNLWHGWRNWRSQRSLGYAASIGGGADSVAFATLTMFAGWVGDYTLAAFALTFNIMTMMFMVTLGVGSATSVHVGIAYGARDPRRAVHAGWLGLGVNGVAMAAFAILLLIAGRRIAGLFTGDPVLLDEIEPMLAILSIILLIDGGQSVLASALRGAHDVWEPCLIQVSAYFLLMIPLAYLMAIVMDIGGMGLMYGFLIASTTSLFMLLRRFTQPWRWYGDTRQSGAQRAI